MLWKIYLRQWFKRDVFSYNKFTSMSFCLWRFQCLFRFADTFLYQSLRTESKVCLQWKSNGVCSQSFDSIVQRWICLCSSLLVGCWVSFSKSVSLCADKLPSSFLLGDCRLPGTDYIVWYSVHRRRKNHLSCMFRHRHYDSLLAKYHDSDDIFENIRFEFMNENISKENTLKFELCVTQN